MGTQIRGNLNVSEEVQIIWRNGQLPQDKSLREVHRVFMRKCEIWVTRRGWIPSQESADIVSDGVCEVQDLLGNPLIPVDDAVRELRKAFHRVRARALRRFKSSRRNMNWEDYELSAYKYLETEPQKESNREQQAAELMQDLLDLLRKAWNFFILALDCLSVRDRTLFYEVYGLGQLPASPEDLTGLTRNARNVALYRARQRFLKSLRRVLTHALQEGASDEPAVLEELLDMIDNGTFKDLLAFRRQTHEEDSCRNPSSRPDPAL